MDRRRQNCASEKYSVKARGDKRRKGRAVKAAKRKNRPRRKKRRIRE